MTTVAYRAGFMAADSLLVDNGFKVGQVRKVVVREDGAACGAGGDAGPCREFLDAFLRADHQHPNETVWPALDAEMECVGLIVMPDAGVWMVEGGVAYPVYGEYHAIGSGAPIALAAMDQGASAAQAVRAAIRRDLYTGGEVHIVESAVAVANRVAA